LSSGTGKPPDRTLIRETLYSSGGLLSPGVGRKGSAGFCFLDTRVESECSGTGQCTGTTAMDTMGEEINLQLIKYLHGVRYLLVRDKWD